MQQQCKVMPSTPAHPCGPFARGSSCSSTSFLSDTHTMQLDWHSRMARPQIADSAIARYYCSYFQQQPRRCGCSPVCGGYTDFRLVHSCICVLRAAKARSTARAGRSVTACFLEDLGRCLAITARHWHAVHIHPYFLCSWHEVCGHLDLASSFVHQLGRCYEVLCLASCARPADGSTAYNLFHLKVATFLKAQRHKHTGHASRSCHKISEIFCTHA